MPFDPRRRKGGRKECFVSGCMQVCRGLAADSHECWGSWLMSLGAHCPFSWQSPLALEPILMGGRELIALLSWSNWRRKMWGSRGWWGQLHPLEGWWRKFSPSTPPRPGRSRKWWGFVGVDLQRGNHARVTSLCCTLKWLGIGQWESSGCCWAILEWKLCPCLPSRAPREAEKVWAA